MKRTRVRFSVRRKRQKRNVSRNGQRQGEGSSNPPSNRQPDAAPSSQGITVPSFPDGVKVLRECDDATIDICFVHGLTGNRVTTWTAEGQRKPWPETLLARKLSQARILTYGYDPYILQNSAASENGLLCHATNFLNDLTADRASSNASSRPLVFIAHSLGGLVCKEAMLLSRNNPEPQLRGIFNCIKGIIFLGTPHGGSWVADWAKIPASALGPCESMNTSLFDILKTDENYLESIKIRFCSMVQERQNSRCNLNITCFFEELPLPSVGKVVVSKDAASFESCNSISIYADHRNMAGFSSMDVNGFKRIVGELIRWESEIGNASVAQPTRSVNEAQANQPATSSFNNYGSGGQFNAHGGAQNVNTGSGNQFCGTNFTTKYVSEHHSTQIVGSNFHAPVYVGSQERPDPLWDCLRSLAFPEMDDRFNEISRAEDGTCNWLLEQETYKEWASCDRGLLWIKGKPGSGKSTLFSHVLQHFKDTYAAANSDVILSFFFHGRGVDLQKTPQGLFQSLLHQLHQVPDSLQDLAATFQDRCKTIGNHGEKWKWHHRELQEALESSIRSTLPTHPIWLFIDALDESGEDSAVELVDFFNSLIQKLPIYSLKPFHICFTCRHYPILEVNSAFEICTENENTEDISTFIHSRLSPSLSTITDLIISRAQGVFLWARLVVKQILELRRQGFGTEAIETKVRLVPQKLNDLYCELIEDMTWESRKLIQWICFAKRPLSLGELRWALLIDTDFPHRPLSECERAGTGEYPSDHDKMKSRVQTLTHGLAEVTSDTVIVQFIHQSLQDFFVGKGLSSLHDNPHISSDSVQSTEANSVAEIIHHRLSRVCIRYLAMEEVVNLDARLQDPPYRWMDSNKIKSEFPFLHYAVTSWVAHIKESEVIPQEDLLEYFTESSNSLIKLWGNLYRILERYGADCPLEGTTIMHVMSRYGAAGALAIILKSESEKKTINSEDWSGQTPLWWAAEGGHRAIVRLLLDRGANIEAADEYGLTPLLRAASIGHKAIVQVLLDRGANIEAADEYGWTPLLRAARIGHKAIVQLLLDQGANIETADRNGQTPLLSTASTGHKAIVQLLLNRGANIEAVAEYDRTPLSLAAKEGQEAIVQLLLDRGANIEAVDKYGQTPLLWAAKRGHTVIVQLLLHRGANAKVVDEYGLTPLSLAVGRGHETIAQLLRTCTAPTPNSTTPF